MRLRRPCIHNCLCLLFALASLVTASTHPRPPPFTLSKVVLKLPLPTVTILSVGQFCSASIKLSSLCLSEKEAAHSLQGRRCDIQKSLFLSVYGVDLAGTQNSLPEQQGSEKNRQLFITASNVYLPSSYEIHFMNETMGQASLTARLA